MDDEDAQGGDGRGRGPRRLTPLEEAILDACAAAPRDRPMKAEAIARKVGRDCNSYFRGLLTRLVECGRLRRPPEGGGYLKNE